MDGITFGNSIINILFGTLGSILGFLIIKYSTKIQECFGSIFKNISINLAEDLSKITGVAILTEEDVKNISPFEQKYINQKLDSSKIMLELCNYFDYAKRLRFKILLNYFFVCVILLFFIILKSDDSIGILSFIKNNNQNSFLIFGKVVLLFIFYSFVIYKILQIIILHISERTLNKLLKINGIVVFSTNLVWLKK